MLPISKCFQLPVHYQFLEGLQLNQMTILYLNDAAIEMLQILIWTYAHYEIPMNHIKIQRLNLLVS